MGLSVAAGNHEVGGRIWARTPTKAWQRPPLFDLQQQQDRVVVLNFEVPFFLRQNTKKIIFRESGGGGRGGGRDVKELQ